MEIVAPTQNQRSIWHRAGDRAGGSASGARTAGGMAERVVEGEVLGNARGRVPRDGGYGVPLARGGLAAYIENAMLAVPRRQGLIDCYV